MGVKILNIPNASADKLVAGERAARALADYAGENFTAANKPAGTSDADWAKTKGDVTNLSKAVLMNLAQRPGMEAMTKYRADKNPKTCDAATAASNHALKQATERAPI